MMPYIGLGENQNTNEDSLLFLQEYNTFISTKKFASAHFLLEEKVSQVVKKADYICLMVENCLKHHYRNEDYSLFFLRDELSAPAKRMNANDIAPVIARVRYPNRLLQRIIQNEPNHSWSYKLLGDFYNFQLQQYSDLKAIEDEKYKEIEEKVFVYYKEADNQGYDDTQLNNWLGGYYLQKKQYDSAETYFLKNIDKESQNAISYYYLSEIFFNKKLFTQAYLYAEEAIKNFEPIDVYLKYDAKLLAAHSLFPIGEVDKYLKYLKECIQMLPDEQDAYIELFRYHSKMNEIGISEKILEEMLLHNPFEINGFRIFEKFIKEKQNFAFSDSLFDVLLTKFDTWDEVMGNIYWSKGNIASIQNHQEEADKFWEISRTYMRNYLPEESPILKRIGVSNK